jgi:exopolysaccharide biosynthesis WecB/TagA/CpsF family protein
MSIFKGKYSILDVSITACDNDYIMGQISEKVASQQSFLVAPVASHSLMLSSSDSQYRKILNTYDFILPDSQYIRHALWFLHGIRLNNRVYGPALFRATCSLAQKKKYTILLYGNFADKLKIVLGSQYPNLQCRSIDVTNIRISQKEVDKLDHQIKRINPDIIIIGVGSPKQHEIGAMLTHCRKPVLTVGAAFNFLSGAEPQAPEWMGDWGFEWLFRLILEPKRLGKRYLVSGPLFILLVLKQKLFPHVV